MQSTQYKVIDIFAGPGGLGEGFSSSLNSSDQRAFKIALSIEKDSEAHKTLELRSFFRHFPVGSAPEEYYAYLKKEISREELFSKYTKQALAAKEEAWCAELGKIPQEVIAKKINGVLGGVKKWVLIGGPPCQAYSLVGRSRMRGQDPGSFAKDHRHFLYKEYLKIIAEHQPPVFVMENVKGILSSQVRGGNVFSKILKDLRSPSKAFSKGSRFSECAQYKIYSLVAFIDGTTYIDGSDYVLRSENFGIPQARHRVILLGLREDVKAGYDLLCQNKPAFVKDVLSDFPARRSLLSHVEDSLCSWREALLEIRDMDWFKDLSNRDELRIVLNKYLDSLPTNEAYFGSYRRNAKAGPARHANWYLDGRIGRVLNHNSRKHLKSDIQRYFFAACYAEAKGTSPKIAQFPKELWPAHGNVKEAAEGKLFADRFRVQMWDRPSSTVTSHISKDGHYFIHPDPLQARSLSVREAARLQTFPDNYFFEGNVTAQYHQVGNAVPPLLALRIAETVHGLLERME